MTNLLTEAFRKAQDLPDYLQNELAEQLIEDVENEIKWQQSLSQPQDMKLNELAAKALSDSINGKTSRPWLELTYHRFRQKAQPRSNQPEKW